MQENSVKQEAKQEGIVKWFNKEKGYGFIRPKNSKKDVFVHISVVQKSGHDALEEGEPVEFDIVEDDSGRKRIENLVVFQYVYE